MAISKNFNSCAHGLSRRRCLALLAALPGLAWLPGCSAFGIEPLRIAAHGWLGYAPLFLARDLDYLPRNDIHLMESLSAGDSMELLQRNAVHGAGLTLDEALGRRVGREGDLGALELNAHRPLRGPDRIDGAGGQG